MRIIQRWGQYFAKCLSLLYLLALVWIGTFYLLGCQLAPQTLSIPSSVPVRAIKHAIGETKIPLHPQRVVAIHWYATQVASLLGVKLLGAPNTISTLEYKHEHIVDLGWFPPNIEKVLALKPDLLLGSVGWFKDTYSLWSKIAPTFLDSMEYNGQWKKPFLEIAEALGKTQEAQQIVAQYNARITEFRQKMGDRLNNTNVSIVRLDPDKINLLTKGGFSGVILEEIGLSRPPLQNLDGQATFKKAGNEVVLFNLSKELLTQADGDFLFVVISGFKNQKVKLQQTIQQLQAQPLWSKLKAVQQGKFCIVGEYWTAGSYLAANLVLDDLFRCLLKEES